MDASIDLTWPEIDKTGFDDIVDGFDYVRAGYANAILYLERASRGRLGFELNDGRCFVNPGLTVPDESAR